MGTTGIKHNINLAQRISKLCLRKAVTLSLYFSRCNHCVFLQVESLYIQEIVTRSAHALKMLRKSQIYHILKLWSVCLKNENAKSLDLQHSTHLAKNPSHLKQNGTQEKTPFSGTVFHTLSHGVLSFVASVSSKNH